MAEDVFMVSMPEGYTEEERHVWRESIKEALEAILPDAHHEVESYRVWRGQFSTSEGGKR